MKIRQKLVLGFLAIGLLVAVVGGVSIKYTAEIREDIDTIGLSNLGEKGRQGLPITFKRLSQTSESFFWRLLNNTQKK